MYVATVHMYVQCLVKFSMICSYVHVYKVIIELPENNFMFHNYVHTCIHRRPEFSHACIDVLAMFNGAMPLCFM